MPRFTRCTGITLLLTLAAALFVAATPATASPSGAKPQRAGLLASGRSWADTRAAPQAATDTGILVGSDPSFDVVPNPNFGQADVQYFSIDYSTRAVVFGLSTRVGSDPFNVNWQDGITLAGWLLDSTGGNPQWEVDMFNDGTDTLVAAVYDINSNTVICEGTPRWDGNKGYFATIDAACFGNPAQIRFQSGFLYDENPGNPGTSIEKDFGPDDQPTGFVTPHSVPPIGPFLTVTDFIEQQYQDFLGRPAEGGGLSYWTDVLNRGEQTPAQMIESFLLSAEFGEIAAPVTRLYSAFFLRIPDYDGLTFWIGQGRAGDPISHIAEIFAESQEFQDTYGDLDDHDFVVLVYNNVLDREPDEDGQAFWEEQLADGLARGEMMLGFSESEEYVTEQYSETYTVLIYVGMLLRSPDTDGFDFWVDQFDNGALLRELVGAFLYSDEYAARFT